MASIHLPVKPHLSFPRTHAGGGEGWGAEGRLPAPGQLCYESLQIARYQAGQHFRAHEVLALHPKRCRPVLPGWAALLPT